MNLSACADRSAGGGEKLETYIRHQACREGARSNQYIAPLELSFFDTCQIHRHSLASLGLPNIPAMNLQSPHSGGTARGRELCHAATADTAF